MPQQIRFEVDVVRRSEIDELCNYAVDGHQRQLQRTLQPSTYEAESAANTVDIQNKTYTYAPDGSIKQTTDNANEMYEHTYQRDFAGRLKKNAFATVGVNAELYKQELSYDAFGHLTNRKTWDGESNLREFTAGYTDNRKTSGGYQGGTDSHDAAGNVTHNTAGYQDWRDWKFDAAGRMTYWFERSLYAWNVPSDQKETITFDGDGRAAKRLEERTTYSSPTQVWNEPKYLLYSSVTGQQITETDDTGRKKKTSVFMGSSVIAEESCHNETCGYIEFKHTDPLTGSSMQTNPDGSIPENDSGRTELNATGDYIPTTEPEMSMSPRAYSKGGSTHNPEFGQCAVDGALQSDWRLCGAHLASGVGEIGPLNPNAAYRIYEDGHGRRRYEYVPWERGSNGGFRFRKGTISSGSDSEPEPEVPVTWVNFETDFTWLLDLLHQVWNQYRCDRRIASIFGDKNSRVGTVANPPFVDGDPNNFADRRENRGEDPRQGVMHQYTNEYGSPVPGGSPLFVPTGYTSLVGRPNNKLEGGVLDTVYSNIAVTYGRGTLARFGWQKDLRIAFVHAGPIADASRTPRPIRNSGIHNAAGSVLVGTIGADGSPYDGGGGGGRSFLFYDLDGRNPSESPSTPQIGIHNHVIFSSGGKRVDPRRVFCGDLGF